MVRIERNKGPALQITINPVLRSARSYFASFKATLYYSRKMTFVNGIVAFLG